MPLKTQLCDTHGRVIEQVVFASLTLSSQYSRRGLSRPEISTEVGIPVAAHGDDATPPKDSGAVRHPWLWGRR